MLETRVLKIINKYNLLSSPDKVLVGVSGGPDSLALLYILNELKVKLGIDIIVAHLNHSLRQRESDLDQDFVKRTAECLGLNFVSKKISWLQSKSKFPSEEALRKARFAFFFDTARKNKIKKIALAHTLDDQAETVLMRLIRGSGLYGLISMLPKRKIGNFEIIRPLIEISRKEILDYLRKLKVKPRIDRTNYNNIFLRNRIRNRILKELIKINPNIKQTLSRFAQQAAVDYSYLYQKSKPFIKTRSDSKVKINLDKFRRLHTALQRMVIRLALEKITGSLRTFTSKHWEEVRDLLELRPYGSIVDLTQGMHIKKDKKNILIYSNKKASKVK